jgi:hypothetical protein
MSDQDLPEDPQQRINPAVTLLMIVIGIILLLPGLCSLIFGVYVLVDLLTIGPISGIYGLLSSGFMPIWFFGLLIGAGGVGLILRAIKR